MIGYVVVSCAKGCGGNALAQEGGGNVICRLCAEYSFFPRRPWWAEEVEVWTEAQLDRALARRGLVQAAERELLRRWSLQGGDK